MMLSLLNIQFIGLLAVVIAVRRFVPDRWYKVFGVVVSAAVIGFASPPTLIAIGGLGLLWLYPIGLLIRAAKRRTGDRTAAKKWLAIGVAGMVLLLLGFKVHRDFTVPWLSTSELGVQIMALIGFSYFFFRAVNYLYMHYLVDVDEKSPLDLLYFILFPPTLTAGPIQKYLEFRKELAAPRPLDRAAFSAGAYRITRGYFRKLCLAYYMDCVFNWLIAADHPMAYTSVAAVVVLYLFFYWDFAGYSDIAVGFGMLMGIKVPENFKKPLVATSITEFWRNWHITLADWFRDHIFIPLGGMRSSRLRAAWLACMIMLLAGLWHGLTTLFVLWGLWHASLLLGEGIAGSKPMPPAERHGPRFWWRVLWTNGRVAVGGLFFLPYSSLAAIGKGLLVWW